MGFNQTDTVSELTFSTKLKAFIALMKLRLSSLVVMSAFFGFVLADGDVFTINFIYLIIVQLMNKKKVKVLKVLKVNGILTI